MTATEEMGREAADGAHAAPATAPGAAGARRAGALVAVAGTLGVALAGKNVLQVPVQVVAERGSQGTAPLPQAAVGIDVLAAGWMTVCVSALAVVCGLLAMRRPR